MADLESVLAGLRAAGEETRFRLLALFTKAELTVSEVTQILRQSQPRVSRHLKLMSDAGLIERIREGTWVFYRLTETGAGRALVERLSDFIPWNDPILKRDLERLDAVRRARDEEAQSYFAANAAEWDRLRALHIPEAEVEAALLSFVGDGQVSSYLDLGTGTGRILEVVAPQARRAVGIDLNNEMLSLARMRIEKAHLSQAQVRRGDLFELPYPDASFDLVTIHQVLHYLEDPTAAIDEAARVLMPGGRIVIADFAPHMLEFLRDQHQHRRLGFSDKEAAHWFKSAGLSLAQTKALPPRGEKGLTVMLWMATAPVSAARRPRPAEAA
jgi:ubiquinone/menaquinone biosynthesis C-methylase UbiE